MNSLQRRFLLLLGGLALLLLGGSGDSSLHIMRNFYTVVSEPSQGLPQFTAVGYVDDQLITHYDIHTREKVPRAPWMKKVEKECPEYWAKESEVLRHNEDMFRADLAALQDRYNQNNSSGLHTLQLMYGCEVGPVGQFRGGHWQFGYDGEDFLSFDRETLTWTARGPQAEISKRKLDPLLAYSKSHKTFLEEECIEWLLRYLKYGKETLQRTERPTVKVARKRGYDGQETLICWAHGFYPMGIDITWTKDGEDRSQETLTGGVVPNSDGTYTKWVSIEVDPNEKDRYSCQVGHNSLMGKLDLAWEEPVSSVGFIVGVAIVVLAALILAVAGVALYMKKHRSERGYKATPGSDQGSDSNVSIPVA